MQVYKLPNGDYELPDFFPRKSNDWLHLVWVITHQCSLSCPYCIGWKSSTPMPTLLNMPGGIPVFINNMEKLRENAKKNVYLTITGGEPSLVPDIAHVCAELGKRKFAIEFQSNLITNKFSEWVNCVDPKTVGLVETTYHGWKLDTNEKLRDVYINNFVKATEKGFPCVLKTIVLPSEVTAFPSKMQWLKTLLPEGTPILPLLFISNTPKSITESNGAYPQAYTAEEKEILFSSMQYRRIAQQLHSMGGGFFKGMHCAAGCNYAYMDINGYIYPCFGVQNTSNRIGDFNKGIFNFPMSTMVCPVNYCMCVLFGLWYGVNPWDYIPGAKKEEAYYCRFGPAVKL